MTAVAPPLQPLYDVAVVGLGPVGATLANLLSLRGLRVLVLEREAGIFPLPRAIHFDGECMRVFQAIGIAAPLAPQLVVAPGMRFVDEQGRLLLDWQRPTGLGPQGWHASYRFHQPDLERALRERLATAPGVDVRTRHEVFALEPQHDQVALRLEDTTHGRLLRTAARFVVGCDGARSTVRRFMDTELDDLQSHERWLVVDVVLHADMPHLGDHSVQYCDPQRPATYVRGAGLRRRWELMMLPGEDATEMTRPEVVWNLLSRWVTPAQGRLERPAVYTFHSVVARGWRKGRLLIAGDAAHQTPPFMGQGLCAGVRDASNLAWKLAEVLHGEADPALLDSYETERSPHVREFIRIAVGFGALIQTTDPDVAARRNAEMLARPQVFNTPQPRLGPGAHEGAGAAGTLSEQPRLAAHGALLDDLVGYQWAWVVLPAFASRLGGPAEAGVNARVVAADSAAAQDWLARLDAIAVLVRPDRYIAALARDAVDLDRLLERRAAAAPLATLP